MLVMATSEQFLQAGGTLRAILASESHWLQPLMVFSVHWWPAPAGVGRVLMNKVWWSSVKAQRKFSEISNVMWIELVIWNKQASCGKPDFMVFTWHYVA